MTASARKQQRKAVSTPGSTAKAGSAQACSGRAKSGSSRRAGRRRIDQEPGAAAEQHPPDDQRRLPDPGEEALGGVEQEHQGQGEEDLDQRRRPGAGVEEQVADGRQQGEGDQQQHRRHHPRREKTYHPGEEAGGGEEGQKQAADQDRAVDHAVRIAAARHHPDQQHRRRPGDQRQAVPPEHLHRHGQAADQRQLLQVEGLGGRVGRLQVADHAADDDDRGDGDGQPLQAEEEQGEQRRAVVEPVTEFH